MSAYHRRQFRPAPGTGRCSLCGQVEDEQHVAHPWWQIVEWLWHSHVMWRVYMVFGATLVLSLFIGAARAFVERRG